MMARSKEETAAAHVFLSLSLAPLYPTLSYHITSGQGKKTIDPKMESGCEREDIVFLGLFFFKKKRVRLMLCCVFKPLAREKKMKISQTQRLLHPLFQKIS